MATLACDIVSNLNRRQFLGHGAAPGTAIPLGAVQNAQFELAVGISITARRMFAALAAVLLMSACSESTANTRFDPLDAALSATTAPSVTTTLAEQPLAPWTERRFSEPVANNTTRTCVEVTALAATAASCLGLSGVSSWTVAGQHFVFGRGDVPLTDGSIIRAGADGLAIGALPRNALPSVDASGDCNRHGLAAAIAEHYPDSAPAWIPTRCADDQLAAADVLLGDRSAVVALIERSRAGRWDVIATFRAPVRCSLLDTASRVKCKLLRYDD